MGILLFGASIADTLLKFRTDTHLQPFGWAMFVCMLVLFYNSMALLIIPYLKFDENGFVKWTFLGYRKYNWNAIKSIGYSKVLDQFFFFFKRREQDCHWHELHEKLFGDIGKFCQFHTEKLQKIRNTGEVLICFIG